MLAASYKSNQQIMAVGENNIMMVLPSNQNDDRVPIKHNQPNRKIRLVDPEAGMDTTRRHDCPREGRLAEYDHVNGFFKGLLIMLPCSILLWVIAVWGVRSMVY